MTAPAEGDLSLEVQVENQGDSTESDVLVTAEADGSEAGEGTIDTIDAGAIETAEVPLDVTPSPGDTVTLDVLVDTRAGRGGRGQQRGLVRGHVRVARLRSPNTSGMDDLHLHGGDRRARRRGRRRARAGPVALARDAVAPRSPAQRAVLGDGGDRDLVGTRR